MVSQDSTAAVRGKQFQSLWRFIPACSPVSCSPSCRSNCALHSCELVGGKQRVGIAKLAVAQWSAVVSLPWLIQPKGIPTNILAVFDIYSFHTHKKMVFSTSATILKYYKQKASFADGCWSANMLKTLYFLDWSYCEAEMWGLEIYVCMDQNPPEKSHLHSGNVQKDKMAVVVGWGVTTDCYHGNSKPWISRLGHTVCRIW